VDVVFEGVRCEGILKIVDYNGSTQRSEANASARQLLAAARRAEARLWC